MCRETFHSHQDPLKCPSLPLVLLLLLRDPVLYLEHVGRDRLQPGGDGELRLDGDVDHGVVPAGLPQGQMSVRIPRGDITGQCGEELGAEGSFQSPRNRRGVMRSFFVLFKGHFRTSGELTEPFPW